MRVTELCAEGGMVSWTDKPVTYFTHTIDRTLLEHYFQKLKSGGDTSSSESRRDRRGRLIGNSEDSMVSSSLSPSTLCSIFDLHTHAHTQSSQSSEISIRQKMSSEKRKTKTSLWGRTDNKKSNGINDTAKTGLMTSKKNLLVASTSCSTSSSLSLIRRSIGSIESDDSCDIDVIPPKMSLLNKLSTIRHQRHQRASIKKQQQQQQLLKYPSHESDKSSVGKVSLKEQMMLDDAALAASLSEEPLLGKYPPP